MLTYMLTCLCIDDGCPVLYMVLMLSFIDYEHDLHYCDPYVVYAILYVHKGFQMT